MKYLFILSFTVFFSCNFIYDKSINKINSDELVEFLEINDAILVDVRRDDEYISGHIENSININDMPNANIAILLGNEKSGLSNELLKKLDGICSIETSNNVDSLNVSVAAGIVMEKIYNKTRLK